MKLKLAIILLLGAASLGLENVLVLQGDPIAERAHVTAVADYRSTGMTP